MKKNILFITPILEHPPAGGPQLRIENTIKVLSDICSLDIIHIADQPSFLVTSSDTYFRQFSNKYTTLYRYPKNRIIRFTLRFVKKIFSINLFNPNKRVVEYIKKNNIDVVWFGFGNISYPLIKAVKESLPTIKVVCDTDSVWSRFILRELPYTKGARKFKIARDGALKQAEEQAWVKLCEVTTAVSEVDAEYYRSISAEPGRVKIFSNVIDIHNYSNIPAPPENYKNPCIFLAGSFGPNSAMNMATNWILNEVLPILHNHYPNLHFYIVGRNSDREFGQLANETITVTGMLDSVLPYLYYANVALVPLKFESGTRFKILEAGACRVPLVSTTLGAEGIPVKNGQHILIADDPTDFAKAIMYILDNPEAGSILAENCYQLVAQNYSIESLKKEAIKILDYLGRAQKP